MFFNCFMKIFYYNFVENSFEIKYYEANYFIVTNGNYL